MGGNDSYGNLIPFYGVWRDELCHISYYSRDRKRQRGPENYFARARTRNHQGASIFDVRKEKGRGVKKYPKFENKQYRFCGQRGEGDKISKNYVDVVYGSPLTTRQRGKKRGDAAAWGRGRGVSSSCLRRRRRLRCHHVRNFRLVTRRRGGAAPLDASTPNSIRQRRRNWPACSLVCRLVRK